MNATQIRIKGLADIIANQVQGLVIDHLEKVEAYAAESDLTGSSPVKAQLKFTTTWPAGAAEPLVNTRVSYTLAAKDETEDTYDPNQVKMDFATETETKEQD